MERLQTTKPPSNDARVTRKPAERASQRGVGHPLIALQAKFGNRAAGAIVQAKLKVGEPGDVYEQEADRVADEVMRMPDGAAGRRVQRRSIRSIQRACPECEKEAQRTPVGLVQRKCLECEKEEQQQAQRKPLTGAAQRQQQPASQDNEDKEEEQTGPLTQASPAVQRDPGGPSGTRDPLMHYEEEDEDRGPSGSPLAQRQEDEEDSEEPEAQMSPVQRQEDEEDSEEPAAQMGPVQRQEDEEESEEPAAQMSPVQRQEEEEQLEEPEAQMSPVQRQEEEGDESEEPAAQMRPLQRQEEEESESEPADELQTSRLQRQAEPEESESDEEETLAQTKAAAPSVPAVSPQVESGIHAARGRGREMSEGTRQFFETRFGSDFSAVRVHTDAGAVASARHLRARAFTVGNDIFFSDGHYRPESAGGRRLLAHELTHVVQQSGGASAQRAPLASRQLVAEPVVQRDEDDLEDPNAAPVEADLGGEDGGDAEEEKDRVVQTMTRAAPATARLRVRGKLIQALGEQGLIQRAETKTDFVDFYIDVQQPLTQEEFRVLAMRRIFGRVLKNVKWRNSNDSYVPENSPYTVRVDTQLLKQQRGQASKERGISVGEGGGITGAKERAKTFHAGPVSAEKSALMNEIDRRYFEAVGDKTKTKIKPGEKGKAELWRMIRDEMLFQHEYIANLPPKVKELIKFSLKGRDLTPADYDKLFAIAKKIEKMPAGQVSDYASKVTGATTDLEVFEASLEKYIAEMAERGQQGEEREKTQTKLIGLEEVYKKYKLYKSLLTSGSIGAIAGRYGTGASIGMAGEAAIVRKELEAELQAHGFAGVTEFEAFINKFEQAFEQEAANIATDLLEKYAGKLYRESERYKDPTELRALHQKLGGVRTQYGEFETNAKIWNDYVKARNKARDQSRRPGQGHLRTRHFTSTTSSEAEAARTKAEAAKAAAQSQVEAMSSDHPIFQEEGLPLDKRIDKAALAKASESELGGLLQGHIQNRMRDIGEARGEIEGKPELIYKMDKLMPQFYVQQGIRPGSIHDMIIRDKMKSDAILKLVKGIGLAIVAVALAVVTFGTATPAIIAAGAGIAGAGLGAYMALEEYQEYIQQKNLSEVGLADDPSVVWLVLAVVGAGLDMAAAVKAVKALGPATKAFNPGGDMAGDLAEFTKAVRALEKANEIEAKVARAAEKAAAARKGFAEASEELTQAMAGKVYSFPGPLADPDVYKAVVKMAREAIKTGVYDAQKFIEKLKLARVRAGQGDLTPEELVKAKQAWAEAQKLVKDEATSVAKYGDSMSRLLARADLPDDLHNDIIAQVGRAMTNPSVDDNAVRAAISSMRGAENPHNVREFLAELRHINEVASAKDLAKGSKVYSGVKKSFPDGSLRQFDLGDGIKVDISPVAEADALYRAGGKIHLDEVKHTASALVNKLREKPQQLQNLVDWRKAAPDRTVSIVIESEVRWTNLLGTPDVFKVAIRNKIPLKIGGKVFDPAALKALHLKIEAKYIEFVVEGGMSPRAFMDLPEMATLDSAMKFVGYP